MDEARLTQLMGPESARYAINTVQVWQTVDETNVVIDRERLKRLLKAARGWASEFDYQGDTPTQSLERAGLNPGDLDPIP